MAQARRELRGVVQAAEAMQDVGKTLSTYVSAPLAALGALSVKVGGDFQAAFNRVEAATQATGAELDALRAKTKNIALDPTLKFSATQAAAALENLAKNGLSTQQILNGAADATVNLATATGGQLATSADIATDVMNNFNLTATELAASVNNITGTTIASKLDIDNYRMALGQAGGVAGQLGVKFTDFNTALAVTSSGFSSGSDAGTSFKTFLQRLVPQSKEAEQAMRQLGLKFFDAQGQMKPLREIAGQLQQAFKGLSDEQKNNLGTKIFGADSIRTALLLAKDGAEGFDKMAESIGKVNAAAQGKTLSQGFNGALEGLKSAFEGLQIAIAESGLLQLGTRAAQSLGSFVSSLAQLDPALLSTITALAGVAIAVGPVLAVIGTLGLAVPALTAGFLVLAPALAFALSPLGLLAGVALAATVAIGALVISGSQASATFEEQKTRVAGLQSGLVPLLARYDELKAKTTLNAAEQAELKKVLNQVGDAVPSAATAFDSYGNVLAINSGKAREFVLEQQAVLRALNTEKIAEQNAKLRELARQIVGFTAQLRGGTTAFFDEAGGGVRKFSDGEIANLRTRLQQANQAFNDGNALLRSYKGEITEVAAAASAAGASLAAVTGPAKEQADALARLNKELFLNTAYERVLGDTYDEVGSRQRILETGVKSLTEAYGAGSPVVAKYLAMLRETEKQLALKTEPIALKDVAVKSTLPGLPKTLEKLPGFDTSALAASTEAARQSYEKMSEAQKNAHTRTQEFNTNMGAAIDQLSVSVGPLLANFAGQFGDAFGSILVGTASAGDAMTQLFAGITGTLAGFMGTFGQQLVVLGIGKLKLDTLFAAGAAGGPAAIAAGLGLIALSGIAKAVSSSASSSLGGITGGGGSAPTASIPRSNFTPSTAPGGAAGGPTTITHNVVIGASGRDLAGVLTINTDRLGRIVGRPG